MHSWKNSTRNMYHPRPESTLKAWRNRRNSPVRALPGPLEAPHQTPWTPGRRLSNGRVSAEVWLNQRRWDALEESLKAQGSNIERHLQDYLIKLYNETVPFDQWLQIENAITKEELESAQAAEDQKVYAAFHIREHGHDSIFSTGNGEEFLDVAIRLRHYVRGGASAVRGDFSHHFYKTQSITRERLMNWPPCALKIPAR